MPQNNWRCFRPSLRAEHTHTLLRLSSHSADVNMQMRCRRIMLDVECLYHWEGKWWTVGCSFDSTVLPPHQHTDITELNMKLEKGFPAETSVWRLNCSSRFSASATPGPESGQELRPLTHRDSCMCPPAYVCKSWRAVVMYSKERDIVSLVRLCGSN